MTDRHLRARVLLGEADALGVDLADLIVVGTQSDTDIEPLQVPTLAGFVETITATFTPATARTYRFLPRLLVLAGSCHCRGIVVA